MAALSSKKGFMENTEKPKYEGQPVFMNGQEWIVPPLSLKDFRKHFKTLTDTDITAENVLDKLCEKVPVLLAALQRNYPDLTAEQLEEMLDVVTFNKCVSAVTTGSGLRPVKPGE
jgi:hypothetical protein